MFKRDRVEKMWHREDVARTHKSMRREDVACFCVFLCASVCVFLFCGAAVSEDSLFPGTQRRFAADVSGEIFKGDIVLSIDGKPLRGQPMEFAKQLSIGTASNPET